jgi:hypothetical protein
VLFCKMNQKPGIERKIKVSRLQKCNSEGTWNDDICLDSPDQ